MTREVMPPVAPRCGQQTPDCASFSEVKNASISFYGSLLPKNFARLPRLLRRVSTPLESRRDRRTHSGAGGPRQPPLAYRPAPRRARDAAGPPPARRRPGHRDRQRVTPPGRLARPAGPGAGTRYLEPST